MKERKRLDTVAHWPWESPDVLGSISVLRQSRVMRFQFSIPVVTEVVDSHDVDKVSRYADILQIGARNMQNYALLTEIGKSKCPIVLKRGLSATVTEWLTAADYLLAGARPVDKLLWL